MRLPLESHPVCECPRVAPCIESPSGHARGQLGRTWGQLGRSWGQLGRSWGPTWSHLGPTWALLGATWTLLGATWTHFGPTWSHLGPTWTHFGANLNASALVLPSRSSPTTVREGHLGRTCAETQCAVLNGAVQSELPVHLSCQCNGMVLGRRNSKSIDR